MRFLSGHPIRTGVLLCVLAGGLYAVQPVLGKLALDAGASTSGMLAWRYVIAAVVLGAIAGPRLLAVSGRWALGAFAMGLLVYAPDAGLFFLAVDRTSAPLASLLHYAHLAVVVGVAAAVGRERLTPRRSFALTAILGGVVLVAGAASSPDLLGIAVGLAAAGLYSIFVLFSDRLLAGADPVVLSALLAAGAGTGFLVFGGVTGTLGAVGGLYGLSLSAAMALLGTGLAGTALLGGIRRVGPGTASLLVTIEVPATVALGALVLDVRLNGAQLLGAALVLVALVVLQFPVSLLRRLAARRRSVPAEVVPSVGPVALGGEIAVP